MAHGGFLTRLARSINFDSKEYIVFFVVVTVLLLLYRTFRTSLDPREPPAIAPRPPIIGHLLGLYRHHAMYFKHLYDKNPDNPIVTLPSPTGKVYAVFTPELQQTVARSRLFQRTEGNFTTRIFGVEQWVLDAVDEQTAEQIMASTAAGLSGEGLKKMNRRALGYISERLNAVDKQKGEQIPNLYLWIRHLLSTATSKAVWGLYSPYNEPGLIDTQWAFEGNMQLLMPGILPRLIGRTAYNARTKIHAALKRWYEAGHDQDADPRTGPADYVRQRAALLRKEGLHPADFSKLEITIMHGATSNTVPTLFWVVSFIFLRPELVKELRDEASITVFGTKEFTPSPNGSVIDVPVAKLEERSPLLLACYREAIRLASQPITVRKVAKDFTVSDPLTSRTYLFKKDADVMLPATTLHRSPSIWGMDGDDFNPHRFLPSRSKNEEEKRAERRQGAYMPFGGGKHMCPGRHFAWAEISGFVTALLLGYEIEGLKEENVRMADAKMGEAIAKPDIGGEGGSVGLGRGEGWEGVVWRFVV
ncbi:cytochrome P450 [Westerdykella ornata]|uniref:Cytochrome P450 n=1 Tax=Westerdykella ornata TaxID=318751 RepID=A0A6A6JGY5_WESOR|nr:cytochrome P450 [Westerdykella ornata]KAF2275228.1 cytochrome P450 [Westerdykella ornata]